MVLSGVGCAFDQDMQAEVVEVGVPKRSAFDQFDFIVDTFGESICPTFNEIIENLFKSVAQGNQERFERLHMQCFNLSYPGL